MISDYRIRPARYAKGRLVICCRPDGSGFKTRASRLAGALGRWVHRDGGYQVSPAAAARFERLYAAGWDACVITGNLIDPEGGVL